MISERNVLRTLATWLTLGLVAVSCGSAAVEEATPVVEPDETAAVEHTASEDTDAEQPDTTAEPAVETEADEDDELESASPQDEREALVEEITAALTTWQQSAGIPGASLSVRLPDQEPIAIAVGVTDLVGGTAASTDSYFRIGSITKPMTAALVLQLIDEGLIELDEPVETYIPGWLDGHEYASEITIRQLMDHTNGLVEYAFDPGFFAQVADRLDEPLAQGELRAFLATREPLFEPGTAYSYETGGFYTLGEVIELVTGNTAAEEMRSRIFEPAGAENIYLAPQELPPEETVNGYSRGALYVGLTALLGRADTEGLTVETDSSLVDPVVDILSQPQEFLQSAGWTGGGAEAQLESVSAVFKALFDGTVLSDEQIAEMTTTVFDANYGLGVSVEMIDGVEVYSHGGGVPGFRSDANYVPELDVSWAVSANLIPLTNGADVGDLRQDILAILVEAAG